MADTYKNIALEILPANGTANTLIYTPEAGRSGLIGILRAAIFVSNFRAGTTPRVMTLGLQLPGVATPLGIRQLAIPPQQIMGAYLDLIDQFAPTQTFALQPGAALYLQLDGALTTGNRIAIFGVSAES